MTSRDENAGEALDELRFQRYDHAVSLTDRSFSEEYRRRDTRGGTDIAERYHENTKVNARLETRLKRTNADIESVLPEIVDRIDPDYPGHEPVALPEPERLAAPLDSVLTGRSSPHAFESGEVSLQTLSTVLGYAAGRRGRSVERTYPSPGALYPSELFLVAFDVETLSPGVYFYNPRSHRLRKLQTASPDEMRRRFEPCVVSANILPDLEDVPLVFLVTAAFWRAKFKYGPRGYRYLLQESGHVVQNLLLTLTAAGLAGRPLAAFDDDRMNDLLGLDGVDDATTYMVYAGRASRDVAREEAA